MKAAHHRGTYHVRSRSLVAAARADPLTKCWRCGLTLNEHAPHKTGTPARWTAGHVRDSDPSSPLAPEASTCNAIAGAAYGNAKREPRSEQW